MKKSSRGVVRRAIVTPDKHFPVADMKAIDAVCQAIEIVKPDTYIDLGDTGDWEKFSNHYWKNREKPPMSILYKMYDKEIRQVNDGMDIIDKALDNVKCKERHFLEGNHEQWLDNVVIKYPYLTHYKPENALRLEERGYKYWPRIGKDLEIGKITFIHGKYVPIHHAKKHVVKYKCNIIYGHTHDVQRFTDTKKKHEVVTAWSLGCLKDLSPAKNGWLNGNLTNWSHAFAIVDWFSNGEFKVEVVEIKKGRTTVWGNLIEGGK